MLSERWLASVRIVGSTIFGSTRSTASRTDRATRAGSPVVCTISAPASAR